MDEVEEEATMEEVEDEVATVQEGEEEPDQVLTKPPLNASDVTNWGIFNTSVQLLKKKQTMPSLMKEKSCF